MFQVTSKIENRLMKRIKISNFFWKTQMTNNLVRFSILVPRSKPMINKISMETFNLIIFMCVY